MATKQRKIRDSVLKLTMLISALSILLSVSSCNFDDVGRIGRGILTGKRIEKGRPVVLAPNENNYVVFDKGFEGSAVFKYTVIRAYTANNPGDAGLSKKDFDGGISDRYFNEDGSLNDSTKTIVVIDMEMEQQTEQTIPVGDTDTMIHYIPSMYLYNNSKQLEGLSGEMNCFYLEQTEDITRSDNPDKYYTFSMSKGQTAKFKVAFIVSKEILNKKDIILYIGRGIVIEDGEYKEYTYYIPLSIEQEENQ